MLKRLIINIRGTNGSGKSTIPMSMLDDPKMYVVSKSYGGKKRAILTVFPTYGWVAIGTYFNKTGGLDTISNTALTKKAFWYALKQFPEYDLLLEGIIASTVFSTYQELLTQAQDKYPERKAVVLSLLPPIELCLSRIQKRNGGKPIKEGLVANKWKTVQKNAKKFKDAGLSSYVWDTSKVPFERVQSRFFKMVERWRDE